MKKAILTALCASLIFSLNACSPSQEKEHETIQASSTAAEEQETIAESVSTPGLPPVSLNKESSLPDGMALFHSLPFSYGEEEWALCCYIPKDCFYEDELMLDDRCRFLLRAESPAGVYLLFDDTVQLGVPSGGVWIDTEDRLHITIQDIRTARYRITDYIYDSAKDCFLGEIKMDGDGINYIGGSPF